VKKAFVLFIGILLLGLTGICVLPGYILKEADNVTLSEQVVLGDKEVVQGVTVNTANDSMRHLLWTTEFVAGKEPKTEFEFSARERRPVAKLAGQAWIEENKYSCLTLYNRMAGGWSSSSNGGVNLEGGLIDESGLVEAYKQLATETAPGEELSRQIFLSQYMEYFPVTVTVGDWRGDEELSEAYSEFFKIPVPKDATYTISLQKNSAGNITQAKGRPGEQNIFTWRSVSTRSENACYFTFYHYTLDGTRINTNLIPGGFGVYKQPYALGAEGVYMNSEELSMVYSLEEETYPHGSMFLDVNEAGGPQALEVAVRYLTIMAITLIILYIQHVFSNTLEAMGIAVWSMYSGIAEFVGRVLMAKVAINWIGTDALFISEPVAWLSSTLLLIIPYFHYKKKLLN